MDLKNEMQGLYASFEALRQERRQFVEQNRRAVADLLDQSATNRSAVASEAADRHRQMRKSLTRFRETTRRDVQQTLSQYKSQRQWRSKQMQRELHACTRDISWHVDRLLRTSASDRMRNERDRVRTTTQSLAKVRSRVEAIRRDANVSRISSSPTRLRFGV
jgi:hypothetical protein